MDIEILEFRKNLPYLKGHCFLNFAATCPVPVSGITAMQSEIAAMQEPLGKHFYQSLNKIETIRKNLARFIGAHASEIAFVQNTSSAVSTIALALNLQPGDRVLVPDNEFPSNYFPWKNLEKKGIELVPFQIKKNESVVTTLKNLNLEKVKVISVSAVSFETGKRIDLKEFADFCRLKKIYSVVDAIQAIGNSHIDCQEMGFDFLASGAQKWLLGPVGCGFIFARREHLKSLFVPMVGWTSHKFPEYFDLSQLDFSEEMTRFEPGLPNYLPIIGMGESLKLLEQMGIEKIQMKIAEHIAYLKKGIQSLGLELLTGDQDLLGGILCFKIPQKIDHRKVHEYFEKAKISVTVRNDYVRVSPHFFTLESELEQFLKILAQLVNQSLTSAKLKTIRPEVVSEEKSEPVLINGATGNLGSLVALKLLNKGQSVFLLGRSESKMKELINSVPSEKRALIAGSATFDFCKPGWMEDFKSQIGTVKFSGLINASGGLTMDLVENQSEPSVRSLFEVQFFAPFLLIQEFLKTWKSEKPWGVLNVLSSSGRCGYPLLSTYAAAHGALWALSESLQREEALVPMMNFVAQSQHSPLQKLMGRTSLRYYQIGTSFNYSISEDVADDLVEQFFAGSALKADFNLQWKLWLNSFSPEFFAKQIAKVWRK